MANDAAPLASILSAPLPSSPSPSSSFLHERKVISSSSSISTCMMVDTKTNSISVNDMKELDDMNRVLGRGSGAIVKLFYHRSSNTRVALKIIDRIAASKNSNRAASIMNEKAVLLKLHHPHIVKLYGTLKDDGHLYFVLSFGGTELSRYISTSHTIDIHTIRIYASQLASAIGYLHSIGIAHRDIKPKNIMITEDNCICLVDFGSVKTLKEEQRTRTLCGTYHYYAPEIIIGDGYDQRIDWWAFGCLLFEMLTGLPPFYDDNRSKCYDLILHSPLVFPSNGVNHDNKRDGHVHNDNNDKDHHPAKHLNAAHGSHGSGSGSECESGDGLENIHDIIIRLLDKNIITRLCDYNTIIVHPFFVAKDNIELRA